MASISRSSPWWAGVVVALLGASTPVVAQTPDSGYVQAMNLSGPRAGFTFLSAATVRSAPLDLREDLEGFPVISQFGWQWEKRFFTTPEGSTGVTEFLLLLGGVEHSIVLPSLTWLVGIRGASGAEFGVGPNVSLTGGSFVIAGGLTLESGSVNFPVNVGVAASNRGTRFSLLAGFVVASPQ